MNENILTNDFIQLHDEMKHELDKLRGKHIFVAGATGMLAMYMTKFLMYLNTSYDMQIHLFLLARNELKLRNKYGNTCINNEYVHPVIQDVCQPIICEKNIDYIIHAAGSADPQSIVSHPVGILQANMIGTFQLCELAKHNKSELLYLSTREIYGSVSEEITMLTEHSYGGLDPLHSRTCYPESKKSGETILKAYQEECGVPFKIARIAHSYGPGMAIENDGRIMADMMHDLVHKKDFVLKSDGQMKRSFCYISDCVKALLFIMINGVAGEAYNVANETEEIRVVDLANMMANMAKTNVIFENQSDADKKGYLQIPRVTLDTRKLTSLGWKPTVGLSDGIQRTLKSFES